MPVSQELDLKELVPKKKNVSRNAESSLLEQEAPEVGTEFFHCFDRIVALTYDPSETKAHVTASSL